MKLVVCLCLFQTKFNFLNIQMQVHVKAKLGISSLPDLLPPLSNGPQLRENTLLGDSLLSVHVIACLYLQILDK